MPSTRRLWERREQILALELYLRTAFGRIHNKNADIIALAGQINRTPSAVALKMSNFAALDTSIHQSGMGNYSQADAALWAEFMSAPSTFLDNVASWTQPAPSTNPAFEADFEVREGQEEYRTVKVRRNQSYFRKIIMASYNERCAVTDLADPKLLIASHIKPWSRDKEARLDPRNGILLNPLHDRAFDSGLITFGDDLSLIVSKRLDLPDDLKSLFLNRRLKPPSRLSPDLQYIRYHREEIFEKS